MEGAPEMTSDHAHTNSPSEEPYDPAQDTDSEPETTGHLLQPEKPEGEVVPDEASS